MITPCFCGTERYRAPGIRLLPPFGSAGWSPMTLVIRDLSEHCWGRKKAGLTVRFRDGILGRVGIVAARLKACVGWRKRSRCRVSLHDLLA